MTNSERKTGEEPSSEEEKKKKEKSPKKKKKKEAESPAEKKERKRKQIKDEVEKAVNEVMKGFSGEVDQAAEVLSKATGEMVDFSEQIVKATKNLTSLNEAFEFLEKQVREGNIKSLKDLESSVNRITKGIQAKYGEAMERQEKLGSLLEDEIKSREKIKELRAEGAAQIVASIAAQELASKKLRELARAAEESGLGIGMGGERPPDWKTTSREEIDDWFEEKLKKMVMMSTPFAENWRMSWDLERFLASIPRDEREAYLHYAGLFDRTRIEHTCHLSYDGAANIEAIQGVLGHLSLSTVEAALRDEAVVEELIEYQKDAEKIVDLRGEIAELKKEGKDTKDLELEVNDWTIRMKRRLGGKELELSGDPPKPIIDRDPKFDEDRGLAKIEAGRMFIFLGMAAGYDIQELTGGDFFMARVNNLYNRAKAKMGESDRWWKRDKLINWMKQEIGEDEDGRKITGLEVFTHKFGGGFFANLFRKEDWADRFEELGLKWRREWKDDRFINVVKIEDKDKLVNLNFEGMGIPRENQLAADVLDSARVADEVRALLLGHGGFLDSPNFENYLKFGELFKHLRGNKDEIGFKGSKPKGGTERDRLMVLIHRDWLDFYKGPGKATRFFGTILSAGALPAWRPEYRFIRQMKAIDPETGKERMLGYTMGDSDGEQLRLGKSLNSVSVHGSIDAAVRAGCYSPQYAEGLLRDQIKLFKLIPGIGPVRVTQEVIDQIGVGGFVGGFLLLIFAPILEFVRQLGKQLEER